MVTVRLAQRMLIERWVRIFGTVRRYIVVHLLVDLMSVVRHRSRLVIR